jgi:hypothetical protein
LSTRFRAPTTITKYLGETRPELWLADYRLACQLGGTDDDNLIIRNLPLFLSDAAWAWLEHLPPAQISNWDDLVKAFAGNFQGTYVRPRNSWDLQSCRQQPGESLRDYIRWFSKQRIELPNITDSDVIGAFLASTTCHDLVSKLGRKYPLIVDPVIGNVRLTKVLMDGGSSINIIYADTLGLLQINLSSIWAGVAPFHGIIPGKRVQPLGQLDLPICFGAPSNFRKETFTFEVVGFRGTYHAVLGRPCYAKFMAIPNYTYLKLKMPGPNGVITVGPMYRQAYECDMECVEYAEALAESEALIVDIENLSKEVLDAKRHAGNFEPAEAVKSVPVDPSNDASKKIRIGSELDPK